MASITERNGNYRIVVSCGYDIYGNKKVETTTFHPDPALTPKKARKAAEAFAVEFEQKVKNGRLMEGSKTTLLEFTERWLQEYATQNLEPGTIEKYRHK